MVTSPPKTVCNAHLHTRTNAHLQLYTYAHMHYYTTTLMHIYTTALMQRCNNATPYVVTGIFLYIREKRLQ